MTQFASNTYPVVNSYFYTPADIAFVALRSSAAGPTTRTVMSQYFTGGIVSVQDFSMVYLFVTITDATTMAQPCNILAEFSDAAQTIWGVHCSPVTPVTSATAPYFVKSEFGFPGVVGGYVIPISTCGAPYARFSLLTTGAGAASRIAVDMLRSNNIYKSLPKVS